MKEGAGQESLLARLCSPPRWGLTGRRLTGSCYKLVSRQKVEVTQPLDMSSYHSDTPAAGFFSALQWLKADLSFLPSVAVFPRRIPLYHI